MSETTIGLFNPATGDLINRLTVAPHSGLAGFHPDSRRLMVHAASARTLRLIEIERGEEVWSHSFEVDMGAVAWRGDGKLFAASGNDHRIYVWDTAANRLQSVLEGHQNSVIVLRFTHDGSLLISSSWDGSLRVWDPVRGTNLVTVPAGLIRIGPHDRQVALRDHGSLGLWELADGRECRACTTAWLAIGRHGLTNGAHTPFTSVPTVACSPRPTFDGVRLWDPPTGAPVAYLPFGAVGAAAQFSPDGSHLLTRGDYSGARIWPLRVTGDGSDGALLLGPPRFLGATPGLNSSHDAWDRTGRFVMICDPSRTEAVVLDLAKGAEVARLGPHRGLNQCPISPDGHWVATATWKGKDVKVWEVATGQLAWQMPSDSAFVRFSPDGRWMAVAKFPGLECRLFHVGSWRPGPTIRVSREFLNMAFSRDGRLLAIDDAGRVRLVDTESGREVVTLDAGTGSSANFFCIAFSPDGTFLAAGRDHIIHLWDLRRIREQLTGLGLDWNSPPCPPPGQSQPLGPVVLISPTGDEVETGPIVPAPTQIAPLANETPKR